MAAFDRMLDQVVSVLASQQEKGILAGILKTG